MSSTKSFKVFAAGVGTGVGKRTRVKFGNKPGTTAPPGQPREERVASPPFRVVDDLMKQYENIHRRTQKTQAILLAQLQRDPPPRSGGPESRFKLKQMAQRIDEALESAHKNSAALQNLTLDALRFSSRKAVDVARQQLWWSCRMTDKEGPLGLELARARRVLRHSAIKSAEQPWEGPVAGGFRSVLRPLERVVEETRENMAQPLVEALDSAIALTMRAERIKIEFALAELTNHTRYMLRIPWYQTLLVRIGRGESRAKYGRAECTADQVPLESEAEVGEVNLDATTGETTRIYFE